MRPLVSILPKRGPLSLILALQVALFTAFYTHKTSPGQQDHQGTYATGISPLLEKFCFECHSNQVSEAEINFKKWTSVKEVIADIKTLQKLNRIVKSGQMPPKESHQLTPQQQTQLVQWSNELLTAQAKKHAGDPGPVVLRRITNAEYNYSVQDITGISTLQPTRQFPVDGAAGEGFTNTGNAQGMSPALFQKYLAAAKEVASHAMLLDDRIEFVEPVTRRDRSDELVKKIQSFYEKHTSNAGGTPVNLQGIKFDTNTGGRVPLEQYVIASLKNRKAIMSGESSIEEVAAANGLSTRYLQTFWNTVQRPGDNRTFLLNTIAHKWKRSQPEQANALTTEIQAWQNSLWKFNSIGHIGRPGGPRSWMQPNHPQTHLREFRIALPAETPSTKDTVTLYLKSQLLAGRGNGYVRWNAPRLTGGGKPELLLRDLKDLINKGETIRKDALGNTEQILLAADEIQKKAPEQSPVATRSFVSSIAAKRKLDINQLQLWLNFLGLRTATPVVVAGHFQTKMNSSSGYNFVTGWGSPQTPSVTGNSSDQQVRIPGIAKPHSIMVHPSPTLFAAVGWQSPQTGEFEITANIADHHPECGNGVEWFLLHQSSHKITVLWKGEFAVAGSAKSPTRKALIQKGDLISLVVGPREKNHACDLTQVNLTMKTTAAGQVKQWDLAKEVSPNILTANPQNDRDGNKGVWHFYKGNWADVEKGVRHQLQIPPQSLLHQWTLEKDSRKRAQLAKKIQKTLIQSNELDPANQAMVLQIKRLLDPYQAESLRVGVQPDPRFGKLPDGNTADSPNLYCNTDALIKLEIPRQLLQGREILVSAELICETPENMVQLQAQFTPPETAIISSTVPISIAAGETATSTVANAFEEFRKIFPAAVCYKKIVPIDEVVTLTLYYREDDFLMKLFLSEPEKQTLENLWKDLIFVSQEPLKKVVALEQIHQFATQDRPDLVTEFSALFEPTRKRASEFTDRMKTARAVHLREILKFASTAWRRPLSQQESQSLARFYQGLIQQEIDHQRAIHLTLARVLVSPEFLYRRETTRAGAGFSPVSSLELATRLSYFLWSSIPDQRLSNLALHDNLTHQETMEAEVRRMLKSPKIRRLAIHFACQWLHLRNFDQNNNKNERLFPEFSQLRQDMYQETIFFFEDMFRNDGSVLDILTANHSFLNGDLAAHYGIPSASQSQAGIVWRDSRGHVTRADQPLEWRRVEGIQLKGRGGILGMGSFLASQSGASRTSPILRGNWISETILGEKLPKPPKDVPQLPESVPQGLTARQLIERHSSVPQCAKCHARIDPYGFALEQFDAIGRVRKEKVETSTRLVDGTEIEGLVGLKQYLFTQRKEDFVRQFCRKLLGFALGRETQLSDQPLLQEMSRILEKNEYRVQAAIQAVVASKQFQNIRNKQYARR